MDEYLEIERRYLVDGRESKPWREGSELLHIEQHYNVGVLLEPRQDALWFKDRPFTNLTEKEVDFFASTSTWTTRLRKRNDAYVLTYKSRISSDTTLELEWDIEAEKAESLLACGPFPSIRKTRYVLAGIDGMMWEVDEFEGELAGLILAEVELPSSDKEVALPSWVGKEITGLASWSNHALAETLASRTD